MDNKAIGERIRRLRSAAEITQEGLAMGAKIATRALQRIESGEGNPTINTLNAIAEALEVTLEELTGKTSRRLMAETLASSRPVEADQGMLAAAYILECLGNAPAMRRLSTAYLATNNTRYLEELRRLPGGAQVAQALQKLPLAV